MMLFWKKFGLLFWANAIGFTAYGLAILAELSSLATPGRLAFSLITLIVVFGLTGQNIASLLERSLKTRWSLLEKWTVVFASALIVPPLATSLLASIIDGSPASIPLVLAASSWILAVRFHPQFWEEARMQPINPQWLPGTIIALLAWAVFVFQLVSAYYALPDLDPYYWLQQFQQNFVRHTLVPIGLHRPLFSSFGYIFFETAHVDLYAFFKYFLPACFIGVLIPLGLLASRARSLGEITLIYALPAASSSFLLSSFASLPQSVANLLIVTALAAVIYASLAHQAFFFFLAGFVLFGATLFHEMSLLFLLPWALLAIGLHWSWIIRHAKEHWFTSLLISLLFLTYFGQAVTAYWLFLEGWTGRVLSALATLTPNLAFPATYINIDGQPMGWSDWWGVTRYYLFYLGPLAVILGSWAIWITSRLRITQTPASLPLPRPHSERYSAFFLTVLIVLFLVLAEALPRWLNLALLPERALGFLAFLIAIAGAAVFLRYHRPVPTLVLFLALSAAIVNAGGALYINSIKEHLITSNQLASAEWIQAALPERRIILTGSHYNLLAFHSQTKNVVDIQDPLFYGDIRVFDTALARLPDRDGQAQAAYRNWLAIFETWLRELRGLEPGPNWEAIESETSIGADALERFREWQATARNDRLPSETAIFVYFAKASEKNPYAGRPYASVTRQPTETGLIFDAFPKRFERIYALPRDEIVIWKLIQ